MKTVIVRVDYTGKTETHVANAIHTDANGALIVERLGTGVVAVYADGQWITAAVVDSNPVCD